MCPQQGGAAQDVKTNKCRFPRNTTASVARPTTPSSTGTLPLTHAVSSVDDQGTAPILATCKLLFLSFQLVSFLCSFMATRDVDIALYVCVWFSPCHPGPCPPCGGLGPSQYCHCGNESYQQRCADTDFTFQTGKSCNQVCGELLGCGKHSCTSVCHSGLCPPCEEEQFQKCYCGKHERQARCGDGEARTTTVGGVEQTGYYECHNICKRYMLFL